MEVGGKSLVEMKVSNLGRTPLESVTLINRLSDSIEAFELSPEFSYNWLGEELAISLGDFAPGQTKVVEIVYEGVKPDGNATSEVTVSTATGASARDSIDLRINRSSNAGAGGLGGADNARPSPDEPFSGADDRFSGGANNRGLGNTPEAPIRIPADNAAQQQGGLRIDVQSLDRTIQMVQSDRPDQTLPQEARIQVTVENDRATTDTNVDLTLLFPPGVRLQGVDEQQSNLPMVGRNADFTEFYMRRRLEMRPGEKLTFTAVVVGLQPGQATFEVQAISDRTAGTASGRDVIDVRP
jgi:hypothetical protein